MSEDLGIAIWDAIDFIVANEETWALADAIPRPPRSHGGAPRHFPNVVLVLYGALENVFDSARGVARELQHPHTWTYISDALRRKAPSLELPERGPRRHHWRYFRDAYLARDDIHELQRQIHVEISCAQAAEAGLCVHSAGGRLTEPVRERMLVADGKTIGALWRLHADEETGEIYSKRWDRDAIEHTTGDKRQVQGVSFSFVAVRGEGVWNRFFLNAAPCGHREADKSVDLVLEVYEHLPETIGVVYDGALQGVHINRLLKHGMLGVSRMSKLNKGNKRVPKDCAYGKATLRRPGGTTETVQVHLVGGSPNISVLDDIGNPVLTPLQVAKRYKRPRRDGTYRWYNDYAVPDEHGGGIISLRLDAIEEDAENGFNRAENLRALPESDPIFDHIYGRRSEIESINRDVDDRMFLRRARSIGTANQRVDILLYGLFVNSVAIGRHRQAPAPPVALAA